jgi:3-oxoacyl-[acyl-carrier protein] reductase
MSVEQKSVIVTGASRGIGRAIAQRLAADGYAVVVNFAGNRAAADEALAAINASGGKAIAVQADVSKSADVVRLFDETEKAFGGVDALVNNAGVMSTIPIAETDDAAFERMFDVNVRGTFLTLREACTRMRDGGSIVNFSTSATLLQLPGYATYCATKAAVDVYTTILAKEMRGRSIRVNSVAPGPVATELFLDGKSPEVVSRLANLNPFGRLGEPEDIARVVAFLLGPEAGWINGQTVRANGGMV